MAGPLLTLPAQLAAWRPSLTLPAASLQPWTYNKRPPRHRMVRGCRWRRRLEAGGREGFPAAPLSVLLLCCTKGHCLSTEGPWREASQGAWPQGQVSSHWASRPSKHQGRNSPSSFCRQAPDSTRQAQWHPHPDTIGRAKVICPIFSRNGVRMRNWLYPTLFPIAQGAENHPIPSPKEQKFYKKFLNLCRGRKELCELE